MTFLLFDPAFVVGIGIGLLLGGLIATGLIALGFRAPARRTRAEAERINASRQAAESARAWAAAGAANDDHAHTPRSDMHRGAR